MKAAWWQEAAPVQVHLAQSHRVHPWQPSEDRIQYSTLSSCTLRPSSVNVHALIAVLSRIQAPIAFANKSMYACTTTFWRFLFRLALTVGPVDTRSSDLTSTTAKSPYSDASTRSPCPGSPGTCHSQR
eukprot:6471440-Amphidinium_carterae.1